MCDTIPVKYVMCTNLPVKYMMRTNVPGSGRLRNGWSGGLAGSPGAIYNV